MACCLLGLPAIAVPADGPVAVLQGGDLQRALAADQRGVLRWHQQGKQIAVDIASGLAFLHAKNVIHRCAGLLMAVEVWQEHVVAQAGLA